MFVTTGSDGDPIFALRGIGMNNGEINQNPAVTPYIDEVALPSIAMLGFQLFDLERVEVLKGPQGTLYGRNVTGGAINFITRKPSQKFDAYFRASYGRFDLQGSRALQAVEYLTPSRCALPRIPRSATVGKH